MRISDYISTTALVSSGAGSAVLVAGAGSDDLIGRLPTMVIAPLVIALMTLVAYFIKRDYVAVLEALRSHGKQLQEMRDLMVDMDKRMIVIETERKK